MRTRLLELKKQQPENFTNEEVLVEKHFPRAEQFIVYVSEVKCYDLRLSILTFMSHLPDLVKEFRKSADSILCAVHEVTNDDVIDSTHYL